jgi:hypothetical protein
MGAGGPPRAVKLQTGVGTLKEATVSLSTVAGRKMSPAKAADITRKLWEIGHMPTSSTRGAC